MSYYHINMYINVEIIYHSDYIRQRVVHQSLSIRFDTLKYLNLLLLIFFFVPLLVQIWLLRFDLFYITLFRFSIHKLSPYIFLEKI